MIKIITEPTFNLLHSNSNENKRPSQRYFEDNLRCRQFVQKCLMRNTTHEDRFGGKNVNFVGNVGLTIGFDSSFSGLR